MECNNAKSLLIFVMMMLKKTYNCPTWWRIWARSSPPYCAQPGKVERMCVSPEKKKCFMIIIVVIMKNHDWPPQPRPPAWQLSVGRHHPRNAQPSRCKLASKVNNCFNILLSSTLTHDFCQTNYDFGLFIFTEDDDDNVDDDNDNDDWLLATAAPVANMVVAEHEEGWRKWFRQKQ